MSPPVTPPLSRLLSKVVVDEATGCWIWQASRTNGGYGRFYYSATRPRVPAHRAAYELLVGAIPEGLTLDHLCRTRHCVNPDHLEPTTMRENLMRGDTPAARNAAKTVCIHGHEFTEANTYVYADGRRTCRACIRERARLRMRIVRASRRDGVEAAVEAAIT